MMGFLAWLGWTIAACIIVGAWTYGIGRREGLKQAGTPPSPRCFFAPLPGTVRVAGGPSVVTRTDDGGKT